MTTANSILSMLNVYLTRRGNRTLRSRIASLLTCTALLLSQAPSSAQVVTGGGCSDSVGGVDGLRVCVGYDPNTLQGTAWLHLDSAQTAVLHLDYALLTVCRVTGAEQPDCGGGYYTNLDHLGDYPIAFAQMDGTEYGFHATVRLYRTGQVGYYAAEMSPYLAFDWSR